MWIKGIKEVHVFILYDKMLYNAILFFFCRRSSFAVLSAMNIKRIRIMPFLTVKHAYVRYNQLCAIGGGCL